jgi:hypothetical protein
MALLEILNIPITVLIDGSYSALKIGQTISRQHSSSADQEDYGGGHGFVDPFFTILWGYVMNGSPALVNSWGLIMNGEA